MKLLVCGGAGYIGSHMVRMLLRGNHEVIVYDNLSTGHAQAVPAGRLVQGDIGDASAMRALFAQHTFDGVMHFCASSLVGESVEQPYRYYENNVARGLVLLEAMRQAQVTRLVFSSTAATYGTPQQLLIDETHPQQPINPYGASKLMVERILADAAAAYGLRSVSLRYFNAAGADPHGGIGELHNPETHLIPNILRAALSTDRSNALKIFGDDYDTRDGTCLRDYVHVNDLALAHLQAFEFMAKNPGAHAFNLGNGEGFSVREVIDAAVRVTGRPIAFQIEPRRAGDPPTLVADSRSANDKLLWKPTGSQLDQIIASAWSWHQRVDALGLGAFHHAL